MIARRVLVLLLVVVASGACTGETNPPSGPTAPASSASAPPSVDTGDVSFEPGEFEYSWNGVDIRFSMSGSGGTLEIDNGSGGRLPAPSLYAILGDGTRRDASIDTGRQIPEGERTSFEVTFPDDVDETSVGLIVLLIGSDNWGALAPVPAA